MDLVTVPKPEETFWKQSQSETKCCLHCMYLLYIEKICKFPFEENILYRNGFSSIVL